MGIWRIKFIYDNTFRRIKPLHRFLRWLVWHLSKAVFIIYSKATNFELPREQTQTLAPYFSFSWITGQYERGIIAVYTQILRPGMQVVDVGAHCGYHTIRFAQLVGPNGKVFAFDPCPSTCDVLVRNIRRRGLQNVVVEKKAVGDMRGWVDL